MARSTEVEVCGTHLLVAGRGGGDVLGDAFARRHVPDGEGDRRTRDRQGAGRLGPEAKGGSGDDRAAAGEVDPFGDLVGQMALSQCPTLRGNS